MVDVGLVIMLNCVEIIYILQALVSGNGLFFYVWILQDGNIVIGSNDLNVIIDVLGIYIL